jgi:hypothetical protein
MRVLRTVTRAREFNFSYSLTAQVEQMRRGAKALSSFEGRRIQAEGLMDDARVGRLSCA